MEFRPNEKIRERSRSWMAVVAAAAVAVAAVAVVASSGKSWFTNSRITVCQHSTKDSCTKGWVIDRVGF